MLLAVVVAVEEVESWAQVLVAVEAMTPPSVPHGFLQVGSWATASQPGPANHRHKLAAQKGCRDPHLPRRDGGWPPRHATCPDLGLLLATSPPYYQSLARRQR